MAGTYAHVAGVCAPIWITGPEEAILRALATYPGGLSRAEMNDVISRCAGHSAPQRVSRLRSLGVAIETQRETGITAVGAVAKFGRYVLHSRVRFDEDGIA